MTDAEETRKKKASAHFFVAKIAAAEGDKLGMSVSRQSVATLTELFLNYTASFAQDLESFCHHARRTTVQPEDVRLCARKSKTLHSHITQKLESLAEASEERRKGQRGNKRKKTDSDTTDSVETTKKGGGKKATSKYKGKEKLKPGQEAGEEEEEEGGRGVNSIGYASPLLSDEDEFV